MKFLDAYLRKKRIAPFVLVLAGWSCALRAITIILPNAEVSLCVGGRERRVEGYEC